MGFNIKDKDNNTVGRLERDDDSTFLVFLLICLAALYKFVGWVSETLHNWETLTLPYKYIAAFYYYIVAIPIKGFSYIWEWGKGMSFTAYPNINLVINCALILIYSAALLSVIFLLSRALSGFLKFLIIVLSPALVATLWYLVTSIYHWLIAQ